MIFQRFITLLTDPELRNHRQVNKGKRDQRAKVNQRRRHHQVKINRQQRDRPDQDDVHRWRTPFRMNVTEEVFREYAVAPHYVHQARYACMRSHTGSQYGDSREDQRAHLEGFTRHVQHDFRLRRIRIFKARDIREVQLQEIGCKDEDQAANQRGQENRTRDHALSIFGLFRQVTDAVKAGKGEAQDRRSRNHRDNVRIAGPERTGARQRTGAFAFKYAINHHAQNDRNQHHL